MWNYVEKFLTFENFNFLIGAVGTALAIWSLLKDRVRREFLYTRSDTTIIGSRDETYNEKLEIRFDGQVIPRLTKTSIVFWNKSGKTIDRQDIAPVDRLRLTLGKEAKLISASVTNMSIQANNASIDIVEQQTAFVDFDYIDAKQGFKVTCLHTGKWRDLEVLGTLKGLGFPRNADFSSGLSDLWGFIKFLTFVTVTFGTGISLSFAVNYYIGTYVYSFVLVIVGVIFTFVAVIAGFITLDAVGWLESHRDRPKFLDDEQQNSLPENGAIPPQLLVRLEGEL